MTTLGRMGGWEDARKDRKDGKMTILGIDSYITCDQVLQECSA